MKELQHTLKYIPGLKIMDLLKNLKVLIFNITNLERALKCGMQKDWCIQKEIE